MSNEDRPRTVIDVIKSAQKANARRRRAREKRAAEIAARKPGEGYEPCIVSFIDVLGFRDMLTNRHADDISDVLKTLRDSISSVEKKEKRHKGKKWMISQSFTDSVSDAVVRVRVFDTQYRDGAFFHEILDLLHAQVECIQSGVFVRGGVAVGDAHIGQNGNGPIFGPAMVSAYEIESEKANYPRIVIDKDAYDHFLGDNRLHKDGRSLDQDIKYVDDLLKIDEEGNRLIDYLRASRSEFDDPSDYLSFLKTHYTLVNEKLTSTDDNVRAKFNWLARYHNEVIGECERKLKELHSDSVSEELELLQAARINITISKG